MIQNIITKLQTIQGYMEQYIKDGELQLTDALSLYDTYHSIAKPSILQSYIAKEAETEGKNRKADLIAELTTLADTARQILAFYDANEESLLAFNPQPKIDAHIKTFYDAFDEAQKVSVSLWKDYNDMEHRLSSMVIYSDEYNALDAECEALKAKHDAASAHAQSLHDAWTNERKKMAGLYYFDFTFIEIIASRYLKTAARIISSMESQRKEDGV